MISGLKILLLPSNPVLAFYRCGNDIKNLVKITKQMYESFPGVSALGFPHWWTIGLFMVLKPSFPVPLSLYGKLMEIQKASQIRG